MGEKNQIPQTATKRKDLIISARREHKFTVSQIRAQQEIVFLNPNEEGIELTPGATVHV